MPAPDLTPPECVSPPLFETGNDVEALRAKVDVAFVSTYADTVGCASGPDRAELAALYAEWTAFRQTPLPNFGAAAQAIKTCEFSQRLKAYRDRVLPKCAAPPPPAPKPGPEPPHAMPTTIADVALFAAAGAGVFLLVRSLMKRAARARRAA